MAANRENREESAKRPAIRVWDAPTRLFHWALVGLVAVSVYTGKTGGMAAMDWHMRAGFAVLALVLFRIVWGFAGSRRSRFADFLRGPGAVIAHLRALIRRDPPHDHGHNPAGGWVVVVLLILLGVQAGTGLFANDDIFTEGPLAASVAKSLSDRLTGIHHLAGTALLVLIGLHVAAVAFYRLWRGEDLIRPMLTGRKEAPEEMTE
ncbi:MAG: cytochrome b/b6 domain-containing protein, partial [Rhodospirillales bacterium]|nr:cytochrome b/b6 domain-containing protein [Rhodospirillales bacterium]